MNIGIDPATGKTMVTGGNSIMYHYAGASLGALLCGLLSQALRNRKRALLYFLLADTACIFIYISLHDVSVPVFYLFTFFFGIANGYWSVFMTVASEQFGTNIRATVTTTTPNFVRGAVVPMTAMFLWVKGEEGNIFTAAIVVGAFVLLLAFLALWSTKETYGKDLDYLEET
jgi:putative MFS transporter